MRHSILPSPTHKRQVRITESDLRNIVKQVIREGVSFDMESKPRINYAIETLADLLMSEYDGLVDLSNATDLDSCSPEMIIDLYSLANEETGGNPVWDVSLQPFSVREVLDNANLNIVNTFEEWVKDNWNYVLDDYTIEAIYDARDNAADDNETMYGGGGYEFMNDFAHKVAVKAAEKLMQGSKSASLNESIRRTIRRYLR